MGGHPTHRQEPLWQSAPCPSALNRRASRCANRLRGASTRVICARIKVAMSLDGASDMAGAATAVSAAAANTHHRFGAFGDPNLLGVNTVRGFSTRDFHGV
jgi:hypothetical protein